MVSGTTQVVAVIGHPIAQVKSPDNFNRYFAEQHMDSVMIPVDIVPDAVAACLPQRPARLAEHERRAGDGTA